jgi:deazaflavin-dependent oxidoreductase (nitroreductase family)
VHYFDRKLLDWTNGRFSFGGMLGWPVIEITTLGAKTHTPRTVPLIGLVDGDQIALVASSFGREHNPAWYYNLKAHPQCDVRFNGRTGKYIAREAEGEEYEHYWQLALSYYAGYEKYKERASHRHIPLMLLERKK